MDITSYLLGKNAGGGSGSGGLDWSAIGYSGTPQSVTDDYNYAKNIYDNWDSTQADLSYKFQDDLSLKYIPLVDTSNATNSSYMFSGCSFLEEVPLLNTSNITNMQNMFSNCIELKSIPLLDTSNVATMRNMFVSCSNLENVPILNTSKIQGSNGFTSTFSSCFSLTDTSVDNILQMCIGATSYTGTKTLAKLGFNATNYPATRIQALPHYQDFINAGWTIGY